MAKQQFGIFNGNSHTSQYAREVPAQTLQKFDLNDFALSASVRYDVALTMIRSANNDRLFLRGLARAAEFARQLRMLAEFADDEAVN